jgi:hypothetical protein
MRCLEQFLAAAIERAMQFGDQRQRIERQDGFVSRLDRSRDLHAFGKLELATLVHVLSPIEEWVRGFYFMLLGKD